MMIVLELNCFDDFTGLKALHTDLDPFGSAVNNGADMFQIRDEPADIDARYLLADAAFFLCQAAPLDGSSGYRFFAADFANFRH